MTYREMSKRRRVILEKENPTTAELQEAKNLADAMDYILEHPFEIVGAQYR